MAQDIAAYIRQIEERLERLLASGWRNAAHEARSFASDGEILADLGLPAVAERLRAVATADDPVEALRAVVLAITSCRLLRAHLAGETQPAPGATLLQARRARGADRATLLPLCRLAVQGEDVWSCIRSRGYAWEWLLLDPPTMATTEAPWLTVRASGFPAWRGRYPFGEAAEVTRVALSEPAITALTSESEDQPLLRELRTGKIRSAQLPLWGGGYLRLDRMQAPTLAQLPRLDERFSPEIMSERYGDALWGLVWEQHGERALVAAFAACADGLRVVHLVPGCPSEAVPQVSTAARPAVEARSQEPGVTDGRSR